MKNIILITILISACVTACKVNSNTDTPFGPKSGGASNKNNWPEYSTESLKGNVMGTPFKAGTVTYSTSLNDPNMLVLSIYGSQVSDACSSQASLSSMVASIHVPKQMRSGEIVVDLENSGEGVLSPVVFSQISPEVKNVIASRTKLRIENVTNEIFSGRLYAYGVDEKNQVSEINGYFDAINCEPPVPFSFWKSIVGTYFLSSFEGSGVASDYDSIKLKAGVVSEAGSNASHDMVVLPLVTSVSSGSSSALNFGPIEGLGTSSSKSENGKKTYYYQFSGPVVMYGTHIDLTLNITMRETNEGYAIKYLVKIPSEKIDASHSLEIRKY